MKHLSTLPICTWCSLPVRQTDTAYRTGRGRYIHAYCASEQAEQELPEEPA